VKACGVVVRLELDQLSFEVATIPEHHVIKKFSPHRSDVLVVMDQFTRRLVGFGVHCGVVSRVRRYTASCCRSARFSKRDFDVGSPG
jgi:hypothetical protein